MSQLLINDYLKQLDLIKKVSGSQRETIVLDTFKDLAKAWDRQHDHVFLAEYPLTTATKFNVRVDCALLQDPVHREKYAQNLKREFPRIPFYAGFWRWAE